MEANKTLCADCREPKYLIFGICEDCNDNRHDDAEENQLGMDPRD